MRFCIAFITLLSLLIPATTGLDISADQIALDMRQSMDDLTTYSYSRIAESQILYSNVSLNEKFEAVKATEGLVNLTAMSGWWSHQLTDEKTGEVLTWQGYLLNGSEYWKENQSWTRFNLTDAAAVMGDYNELPSQVELLNYSDLSIAGTESIDGEDCYKLTGTPAPSIGKTILGIQLFASYLGSPFSLPDDFSNRSFDFDDTELLSNSNVTITAWISKETSMPRRIDIDSSLTITPDVLKIVEPDFRIESTLHEVTVYENFKAPVQILLPSEAENISFRVKGADWRWAVFGLVEP